MLRFLFRRVRITNNSMLPTYVPGELATAVRKWRRVRVGDVVVVRDPRTPSRWLIKRCVARQGAHLDLRGDNPGASTDSRHFGLVRSSQVRYLVLGARKTAPKPE